MTDDTERRTSPGRTDQQQQVTVPLPADYAPPRLPRESTRDLVLALLRDLASGSGA